MVSLRYWTRVGEIDNPEGRPQTRVVVAPKGPSYVFSPWKAPYRARQRDVYTGLVPKGLLSFGGFLGGVKAKPFRVNPP